LGDLSKDINTTFPNSKVKALLNIIYTANWLNSKQNEYFKPYGISPQQYNILRILRGAGEPIAVQTIKDRMLERAPNATRLMDKLCAKGLINRIPCATDRRVVHIEIAKDGLALLKTIDKSKREDLLKKITAEEAEMLSNLLDKLR
tara:strand:+ start:142979 stop:143416 length:438 start_codon:yes stop_codon:yes gene_type:complete